MTSLINLESTHSLSSAYQYDLIYTRNHVHAFVCTSSSNLLTTKASTSCPDLPMPEISMYLPAMKVLKNVIERMKVRQTTRSTSVVSVVSVVLVVSMVVYRPPSTVHRPSWSAMLSLPPALLAIFCHPQTCVRLWMCVCGCGCVRCCARSILATDVSSFLHFFVSSSRI